MTNVMSRLQDFLLVAYRKLDEADKLPSEKKRAIAQTNLANFFSDKETELRRLNLREEVTPLEELRLREITIKEKVKYRKPEKKFIGGHEGPTYPKTGLDKFKDDWLDDKDFTHDTDYEKNYDGVKRVNEWWNEKYDVNDFDTYRQFKMSILKVWGSPMKNSLSYYLMNG